MLRMPEVSDILKIVPEMMRSADEVHRYSPEKGGLDGLAIAKELIEKFLPDIDSALTRRNMALSEFEVCAWLQNILNIVPSAAFACHKKHAFIPPKIRLILEISKDNRCYIFFIPHSAENEPLLFREESPVTVLGADEKDFEKLRKIYPSLIVSLPGGNAFGNN